MHIANRVAICPGHGSGVWGLGAGGVTGSEVWAPARRLGLGSGVWRPPEARLEGLDCIFPCFAPPFFTSFFYSSLSV